MAVRGYRFDDWLAAASDQSRASRRANGVLSFNPHAGRMSFFGFEQQNDFENEKRRFLEGGAPREDVAVYTWGEDSYDGLGDALQEGGDELNDETFGISGPVGEHIRRLVSSVFPTPHIREGL